ncbi:hypothetical protein G6F40_016514 [Rhizopus arrhizus]|nr:hypothetical protein G6F40_016514 [Rhizopus arrhizus]
MRRQSLAADNPRRQRRLRVGRCGRRRARLRDPWRFTRPDVDIGPGRPCLRTAATRHRPDLFQLRPLGWGRAADPPGMRGYHRCRAGLSGAFADQTHCHRRLLDRRRGNGD